jgi:hypothetical protein
MRLEKTIKMSIVKDLQVVSTGIMRNSCLMPHDHGSCMRVPAQNACIDAVDALMLLNNESTARDFFFSDRCRGPFPLI